MKSILVLYPGFPHYRNGILDKLIDNKEIQFTFIGDKENYVKSIKPYDFKSYPHFYHIKSGRIGSIVWHRGLFKHLISKKYDGALVHSSPYYITIFVGVLILKLRKIKIINWCHGILTQDKNLKNYLYYRFYTVFDKLLLYGSYAKKNLSDYGYPENRMTVIYNSLDYKNQLPYRNSLTPQELFEFKKDFFREPKNPQLIFIGRLTIQKKLHQLIEAVKLLKSQKTDVNLLIVGEGEIKEELVSLVQQYNLTNAVLFYGASYNEESNYKLIASSDCCVSPGEVGLTAMHSLMYGTPVISHNDMDSQMPEVEAIVPTYNGYLYEKDKIEDLCKKIKKLIALKTALGDQLSKNCYEIMDKRYNPSNQLEIILKTFE